MNHAKRTLTCFFLATLLGLFACDSSEDEQGNGILNFEDLPEASQGDQTASAAKVDEARKEIERVLSEIYDAEEIDLDQTDFGEADRLYQEAIAADPRNTEAQFGAAITHILALANNQEIQEVQDSLNVFMGDGDEESYKPIAITSLDLSRTAEAVPRLPLMSGKMALSGLEDPLTVSDLQKTIDEEIIPAIDYSLERLAIVEANPDFTFTLTPTMLGDEEEDPLEIDLGEAYILDAQLRLLKAVFQVATAYNFDFDDSGSYRIFEDGSTENILRQIVRLDKTDPDFLTLKSAAKMKGAKGLILEAITKMEQGLEAIRQETDDQEDDIISREVIDDMDGEIDLSEDDGDLPEFFRDIKTVDDALVKIREALEGTVEIEADYDGDEDTPRSTIVFNLGNFFDEPIQDFRKLLPYHEWHVELLGNRNFADELVFTDAEGNILEDSPSLVLPDPSFGGILSNISSTEQLLELFGIEEENLNEMDLLDELGIIYARDGGIVVTNSRSSDIEVVFSTYIDDQWVENQSVPVPAGTQNLDVVRSAFGKPISGDNGYDLVIAIAERRLFSDHSYINGNVYITVGEEEITVDKFAYWKHDDNPREPYESITSELPE